MLMQSLVKTADNKQAGKFLPGNSILQEMGSGNQVGLAAELVARVGPKDPSMFYPKKINEYLQLSFFANEASSDVHCSKSGTKN